MPPPARPKIYHIVHVDKLPSIVSDEYLWCDADISRRQPIGTTIGMGSIKERRLTLSHRLSPRASRRRLRSLLLLSTFGDAVPTRSGQPSRRELSWWPGADHPP